MQINDQEIVRAARQLREEENQQLEVRQWKHRKHRFPEWLAAIPAAAIIGFLLGLWTSRNLKEDAPLTALVDTVFVKVPDTIAMTLPNVPPSSNTDTAFHATSHHVRQHAPAVARQRKVKMKEKQGEKKHVQPPLGRPMSEDNIRYDLLVKN